MRIIRWFLIFSSIAYWYSVFSMENPAFNKKRLAEIPTQILEEEAGINWQNLPINQCHTSPDTSALRQLSQQEVAQAVSNIITIANYAPDIQRSITRVNEQLMRFPEIDPLLFGPEIAQTIAKKFKSHWLYIATQLKFTSHQEPLFKYLNPDESVASEKFKAVKEGIKSNDLKALFTLLKNPSYKKLFARANFGPHDVILADLAKAGKTDALKLFLAAGANINSTYMDHSLLTNAYPNLATLSMLVEHGAHRDRETIFIKLLSTTDPFIKNNKLYYPTLSIFLKARAAQLAKSDNKNPLIIAIKSGNVPLFKWLLAQKEIPSYEIGEARLFITNPHIQIPHKQLFIDQLPQ